MKSLIVMSLLFVWFSTSVYAGNDNGGGGGVFLCDEKESNPYALFLDLWEAEYIGGHPVLRTNDPFNEQISLALLRLEKLDPGLAGYVKFYLEHIPERVHQLHESVIINPPEDAKAKYSKAGCALRGMMYYDDLDEKLQVAPAIFSHLETQTDIAAAWFHEALYKVGREYFKHTDSIQVRRLVGCLFSTDTKCTKVFSDENYFAHDKKCEGPNVKFYKDKIINSYIFVRFFDKQFYPQHSVDAKVFNPLNSFGFNTVLQLKN